MARRRREIPANVSDQVDEIEVRNRAARYAYLTAGGVEASQDWSSPDWPWWERWNDKERRLFRRPTAERTAHYLVALEHLDALPRFERWLVHCRRQAELNTPAARAARRHNPSTTKDP